MTSFTRSLDAMILQPYQVLIEGCKNNERTAQEELFVRFSPILLGICYRYARSKPEAEDMLQEGFIKIYQKLGGYTFKGSFEGWMKRIVINNAIDMIRKTKNQMKETQIEDAMGKEVSDDVMNTLELEYLYSLIQSLPPGYRLVFNLYAIEGFSHKEIGQKLGVTESTSRSQYTRARNILKKKICEDRLESNIYHDAI